MIQKAIKIRLYPNKSQEILLNKHFNSCRFLYNLMLDCKKYAYSSHGKTISKIELVNEIPLLRKEFDWLSEIKAECLQNVGDQIDNAYKNFFRTRKGFPKFKKKTNHQSFTQKQSCKILDNVNKLVFYSQRIKFKCSERDSKQIRENKIKRITYSKNPSGQYHASILIELNENLTLPISNSEIGIDLGLKDFAIDSTGIKYPNPKFLRKSECKLKQKQRRLSRKQKGSKNRNKQRIKVAKIHQKITNQRSYFLHNLSKKLIDKNQVIVFETLKVKNMIKNHKLAKSISDASWSSFVSIIEYKSKWYGRSVIKINTFYPSSKTCFECEWKNENLSLSDREFICESCGNVEDRDVNAAKNILRKGREELPRTSEIN